MNYKGRPLTLSGTEQGIFILILLDQILSADIFRYFLKKFHTFLEVKIDTNRVNLTTYQAH